MELAGTAIGTATVNPLGAWTLPSTGALGLGNQSFVVGATDVAGTVSTDAPPYIITTVTIFTAPKPEQARFIPASTPLKPATIPTAAPPPA